MRKLVLALSLALLPSLVVGPAGSGLAGSSSETAAASTSGSAIVQTALQYLGYPYTTVGNSPSTGFSCIGFVSYVYGVNGIPLPDDLWDAMAYAPAVAFSDLLPGDILFFQNTVWAGLSHTAIYLGGGRFIQAEWYNRGVVISSFTNDPVDGNYWIDHYLGANRPWTGAAAPSLSQIASGSTSSAPVSPPPPQLQDGPRLRVQVAGLNVRLRPSLSAPITQLTTGGTRVVVLKQYRSWDWVQLPDASFGWVSGTGIGLGGRARAAGGSGSQPFSLTTTAVDGLRVHLRPNLAAPAVASASQSQKLLVLKRWHGWAYILLSDGTGGWADGSFIRAGSGQQAETSPAPVKFTLTDDALAASQGAPPVNPVRHRTVRPAEPTITTTVRVRARPGLQAPVLRLAGAGAHVRLLGMWRRWAHVRLPSGQTGWVYSAYLHGLRGSAAHVAGDTAQG